MKILMVSIPSLHFFRWTNQLQNSGHQVYWFDVGGMSQEVSKIRWVNQKVNWKLKWNYPGRIFIKNKFPNIYNFIQKFNEKDTAKEFEKYFLEIQPDVVHSFALYLSCTPIIADMQKYSLQKWIYSSWGSDLYYFQNESEYLKDIKRVLPRINYLFTDCKRDYEIAKKYGFTGKFLGVFPGGGGFHLAELEKYKMPLNQRKTILIKGFQGRSGRAISVLKAIEKLHKELSSYEIVVFGADFEVIEYAQKTILKGWNNFSIFGKLPHEQILKLMGKSLIYIGNSNSDGIPNTLLEAICMDVFPVQSDPGGVTAEVIKNTVNGLLIEDCEDVEKINILIKEALNVNYSTINNKTIIDSLDFELIKNKVLNCYQDIDI